MSRRRKKEYAVIGLATAWNKSFARFFLKKKKIRTIYLCSKIYSLLGFEGRKNNREKEGKKMRRERICIHVYATNERSFTCDRHRRHGANDPAIEYERSPRSRPSSVLSTRSKNNTPFDRSCVTAPPSAPSFSANLQIQRIVNTARFVNTGSSPASFLLWIFERWGSHHISYRLSKQVFSYDLWNKYIYIGRWFYWIKLRASIFFSFSVQKCGWNCWRSWWFCWRWDRATPGPREPVRIFPRFASIKLGIFYRGNMAGARKKWKGKGGSFPDGNKTIRIVVPRTNRVFIRL